MKQFTHAWLAMMAMKRIEFCESIPANKKDDAKALITWFKNYRDFVLQGAWYPDFVFKDMSSSHICKYAPYPKSSKDLAGEIEMEKDLNLNELLKQLGKKGKKKSDEGDDAEADGVDSDTKYSIGNKFRKMPETLRMYQEREASPHFGQKYVLFKRHNLCDRCESFTESLIDSFKMLTVETGGSPVIPTSNHIALRFFILSHYIADGHMPLHCDARSFFNSNEVHTFIEEEWDKRVASSYLIDYDNNRFFYESDGYPRLNQVVDPLCQYVEEELKSRKFVWPWGDDCGNTWDYMSGISQYSYLMAYRLIPADRNPQEITEAFYKESPAYLEHFLEYSKIILADAVESIAKVWLHAWCRYREWFRDHERTYLKEQSRKAKKALSDVEKTIKDYDAAKEAQQLKIKEAQKNLAEKQKAYDDAIAANRSAKTKLADRNSAASRLEKEQAKLDKIEQEYKEAKKNRHGLEALAIAADIEVDRKNAEIAKYGNTTTV